MPGKNQLLPRQQKSKNNKIKSSYLHLCECNQGRDRALATFTIPAMTAKQLQLLVIKEIKNFFAKRLQNLKSDVQYFAAIELGQHKGNPHLHFQLFFEEEDREKIHNAFNKVIENFSLQDKRCKLVFEDKDLGTPKSFNYIIKEFDNSVLSDDEILALYKARKRLKQGETKHIQFHSQSRPMHPHALYKALWFKHNLNYMNVNELMNNGYATRLQGIKLLQARHIGTLPYILFTDGAIRIKTIKLYDLILLSLLFYFTEYFKVVKSVYIYNKRILEKEKINFNSFYISRFGLSSLKGKITYTGINT